MAKMFQAFTRDGPSFDKTLAGFGLPLDYIRLISESQCPVSQEAHARECWTMSIAAGPLGLFHSKRQQFPRCEFLRRSCALTVAPHVV